MCIRDSNIEGIWYEGIGNVGVKPTVSEGKRVLVEVHAFGYNADAYGKFVKIEFCGFRRPETSFSSVDELKRQVDEDILYGKDFVASGKMCIRDRCKTCGASYGIQD